MQDFSTSPVEMSSSLWRHRALIFALIKRDVIGRYKGSIFGILWSFFYPVLMLVVYTFVFSVVFKSRWTSGSDSKTEFALVLFAGLLVYNLFADCISRSPSLIISNVNYVKKVVFPLEVLPVATLGAAFFHMIISFLVWIGFFMVFMGVPKLTTLFLPLVLIPLILVTIGLSWLLASLGVYLRDIGQLIGIVITILMFLTPIFYPMSALPENFRVLMKLNPLGDIIEQVRQILIWGNPPDWGLLLIQMIASSLVAWLGFAWFQKTRKGFADVV